MGIHMPGERYISMMMKIQTKAIIDSLFCRDIDENNKMDEYFFSSWPAVKNIP